MPATPSNVQCTDVLLCGGTFSAAAQVLSREEFLAFCEKYGVFMAPLARMQERMRESVFGRKYWRNMEEKRKSCQSKLYNPMYWAQLQTHVYKTDAAGRR